ncbi:hypothetical protein RvY_02947 [Ramazzottius varieornatus]|uniref:Uncharacterized protein n=1 Tax=Ramazzottius varieornatus TaxID=947166 RepID=A0A1D1ULG1_RAMVA|nr:hypothetical protein RvY_02947 [Ramazzottius varieornatus]
MPRLPSQLNTWHKSWCVTASLPLPLGHEADFASPTLNSWPSEFDQAVAKKPAGDPIAYKNFRRMLHAHVPSAGAEEWAFNEGRKGSPLRRSPAALL